jgi:hypothetical protein
MSCTDFDKEVADILRKLDTSDIWDQELEQISIRYFTNDNKNQ